MGWAIGLVEASNGNFYGATGGGGANGYGFIFKLTPAGKFTNIYSFGSCAQGTCPDGFDPDSPLIQGSNGTLFGTMYGGGAGWGTVFAFTLTGKFATLYTFENSTDGAFPDGVLQAKNGDLYGLTQGTAFSVSGLTH
jgi:uncharacterized repeat protein (TIGR03803 family)